MDALKSFYDEYFKYLPNKFDVAYILHANSGEAYCFLAYLAKACLKKDGAENPLFVATKLYHKDIIDMFFPKANYVYYNIYLREPRLNLLGDIHQYNEQKFRVIFSKRHFSSVNSNLGKIHYFDAMLDTLDIDRKDVSKPTPKITKKTQTDVIRIAEQLNLDLENFVILSPEAATAELMPISFWKKLVTTLRNKGYDIFLNAMNPIDLKCKQKQLTYKEIFALSKMSKGIISLKSGLSEFLLPTGIKQIVLAKKFFWSPVLTTRQCIDAYSIIKLPFVDTNKVFELNTDFYPSEKELANKIISLLEND